MRRRLAALGLLSAVLAALTSAASAEVIDNGRLFVTVDGGVSPKKLPRSGTAPISVRTGASIATSDGSRPPTLREFVLEVNRAGKLYDRGLPSCPRRRLEGTTSRQALKACREALVGRGRIRADIALPAQSPLPSEGRLLAFRADPRGSGRAVLAHVYGDSPLPVTTVLLFRLTKQRGRFGTRLSAELPSIASDWGYVTSFDLRLGRRWRHRGRKRSYLRAGCPAPRGFKRALFPLARGTYTFEDGTALTGTIERTCKAKG